MASALSIVNDRREAGPDRLKANYLYLLECAVLESIVKMVVLSPLLDLAGFHTPPFRITGEEAVQVEAEDEGIRIQGNIDILVLQDQFWLTVIEAKNSEFSLTKSLAPMLGLHAGESTASKSSLGCCHQRQRVSLSQASPSPLPAIRFI